MPGPAASLEASSGLLPLPPPPLPVGTEAAAPAIMQQGQAAREPWEVQEGMELGWPPSPPGLSEREVENVPVAQLSPPQTHKKLDRTRRSNLLTNTFPPRVLLPAHCYPWVAPYSTCPGEGSWGGQPWEQRPGTQLSGRRARTKGRGWRAGRGVGAAAQGSLGPGRKHHSEPPRAVGTHWSCPLRGPEQQADGGSPRRTSVSLEFY